MSQDSQFTFGVSYCERFPALLAAMNATLVVSSHSLHGLLTLGSLDGERVHVQSARFPRLLGMTFNADQTRLTLAAFGQLLHYQRIENPQQHAVLQPLMTTHDVVYAPLSSQVTGFLNTHDMAYSNTDLYIVNTQFSCIATMVDGCSFKPVWQPPFITTLAPEERCHLNGMAMLDGRPAYVSYLAESDVSWGWHSESSMTGAIMCVADNQVIVDRLSMPHSPRWHQGWLYFCESGAGKIWRWRMHQGSAQLQLLACLNGFTRGLKLQGDLAFVGLSEVRPAQDGSERFVDMPLKQQGIDTQVGVVVLDLRNGAEIARLNFTGDLAQIYDIDLLMNCRNPAILEWSADEISNLFVFDF